MGNGMLDPASFPKAAAAPLKTPPANRNYRQYGVSVPTPGVSDYERNSWRWNDPSALKFDLDDARRKAAEGRRMESAAGSAGDAATLLGSLPAAGGFLGRLLGGGASGLAVMGAGKLGGWDAAHWDNATRQLETRLRQLGVSPG